MIDRDLLDKLGSLVKKDNDGQYIEEEDLRFLYSDIGLYFEIMEVLDRNNIKINRRSDRSGILKEKVLEYQKFKDIKIIRDITDLSMYYIYSISFGLSKKYNIECEELIGYGFEGLLAGINNFNKDKIDSIRRYLSQYIYYYILRYCEINYKENNNLQPIENIDKEKCYFMDDELDKHIYLDKIYKIIKTLPIKQREVIEFYYGLNGNDPSTFTQVAKIHNCSRQAEIKRHNETVSTIKRKLEVRKNKEA